MKSDKIVHLMRDEQGLTLVEVLIASVITLVLFLALMQTALLSIDMNAGNALRDEAVRIAEERIRGIRSISSSQDFDNDLRSDGSGDPDLPGADCPPEFVADFGTEGVLFEKNFRNSTVDFCTNMTCLELGGDGDCTTPDAADIRQLTVTVGWRWLEEDYLHTASTIVRRP